MFVRLGITEHMNTQICLSLAKGQMSRCWTRIWYDTLLDFNIMPRKRRKCM